MGESALQVGVHDDTIIVTDPATRYYAIYTKPLDRADNCWMAWSRGSLGPMPKRGQKRGADRSRRPLLCSKAKSRYCFSAHFLPASSHTLPAFSQSSLFVIVEPGPANAGAVNATATAKARMEMRLLMAFSPLGWTKPRSLKRVSAASCSRNDSIEC